jgi:hypothetical protein
LLLRNDLYQLTVNWVTICRSVGVERTVDEPPIAAGLVLRSEREMCATNGSPCSLLRSGRESISVSVFGNRADTW